MVNRRKEGQHRLWLAGIVLALAVLSGVLWLRQYENPWHPTGGAISYIPQVILDPGHGGMDGGAVSQSGIQEKDLNLAISLKTRMWLKLCGIDTVMTRDSDVSLDYVEGAAVRQNKQNDLKARADVAARYPESDFISIHMNQFQQSKYHGAQVFYGQNSLSQQLAQRMQDAFRQVLDPSNDRKIKPVPEGVYVMRKVTAPAVIAECGFLSNPQEAEKLAQDDYQTKAALAIAGAYLRFAA